MGQKHKRFREFWTPFLLRVIRKSPRSMHARVSKVMAQFVLKIEKLSYIMGPTPILEMARAYGVRNYGSCLNSNTIEGKRVTCHTANNLNFRLSRDQVVQLETAENSSYRSYQRFDMKTR